MVDLIFNNFTTDRKYDSYFFKKILEIATKEMDLESNKIELSINLVGEGRIRALNKKYRERNRVTDVLSFPLAEGGPIRSHTSHRLVTSNGVNAIMNLGDIFICLPIAKKHATREGVSLDYKIGFLAIHGFLHLIGHDHEKLAAEKKMFSLQNKILKRLALSV